MKTRLVFSVLLAGSILMGCKPKPNSQSPAELPVSVPENNNEEAALNCKSAAGVFGFLAAVGVYDAWQDRPIEPLTTAKFTSLDGKAMPLKLIYRFAGQDFEMPVKKDGTLILEYSALDPDDGGELCVLDPARAGAPLGGLDLDINTEFAFKNIPAGYRLEVLENGAGLTTEYMAKVIKQSTGKDLKEALGPTNWINIRRPTNAGEDWKLPRHVFMAGDKVAEPPRIDEGGEYLRFSLEEAKAQGIDRWVVSGNEYLLSAVFDPEKVPENYKEILGLK